MRLLANIFEAMKSLISIGCLCLLTLLPNGIDASEVDRNYLHRLVAEVAVVDREYVAKNEHGYSINDIVLALRNLDEDRIGGHSWVLIRLRDAQTIEKYISLFVESGGSHRGASSVLASSYSPWIIPPLIELFDRQEIERMRHPHPEFSPFWGLSGQAVQIVLAVLSSTEEFSDELQEWAGDLPSRGTEPLNEVRDTLMVWWEENEAHFESEDYHLVRPVSWELQEDIEEENLERDEDPRESGSPGDEIPETDEPTPEPDFGTREVDEEAQDRTIWLWGIAGIVLLVLIAFVAFNLRSRRKDA